ncbi:MAG: hypothetical protein Kow00127_14750 [Bacteroidales bacterium]
MEAGPTGIAFSIYDPVRESFLSFENSIWDPKLSWKQQFADFLSSHPYLRREFTRVQFLYEADRIHTVPGSLYEPEHLNDITSLAFHFEETETLLSDHFPQPEAWYIYPVPDWLPDLLKSRWENISIRSLQKIEAELILPLPGKAPEDHFVLIDARQSCFDLLLCKGNSLLFHNVFRYNTPEDRLYFTLLTLDQLRINSEKSQIRLSGPEARNEANLKLFKKYLPGVNLIGPNETLQFAEGIDTQIRTSFYFLFSSVRCA